MSSPAPIDRLNVISIKAFGDLVIAHGSLARSTSIAPIRSRLLVGGHLTELARALGPLPGTTIETIDLFEPGVPAFFDTKKAGPVKALASGWHLRRRLLALYPGEALIFDRLGWRECWLAGRSRARGLPASDNIYRAYESGLQSAGLDLRPRSSKDGSPKSGRVGLFPGSRVAAKALPADIIAHIGRRCLAAGIDLRIFLLDGERPDLEAALPEKQIVPRTFAAMIGAVTSVDAVISADSMPAHIAEAKGLPVFVMSPVGNCYWLPLSSFEASHWALFADVRTGKDCLSSFLGCG